MTEPFKTALSIRWSDLDPNFHLRHSVYYDFCAQQRMHLLEQMGVTLAVMKEKGIGPIIFREECVFRREILFNDTITLELRVARMKRDGSRWSFRHAFMKGEEGTLCATLTIDGAWFDTALRKLSPPPLVYKEAFDAFPRTEDFEWVE